MSLRRKLVFELLGHDINAGHIFNKLGREVGVAETRLGRFAHTAGLALVGVGAAAGALAVHSLHAADKFELAHAKFETALVNVHSSMDATGPAVTRLDKRMELLGFTNTDVEAGLANLTTALGKPRIAMHQLGLAADLSRYKHIDLASAATLVARAEEGNLRALKSMGIDLPIASAGAAKLAAAHQSLTEAERKLSMLRDRQRAKDKLTLGDQQAMANAQHRVELAQRKVNATAGAGRQIIGSLGRLLGGQAAKAAETFAGKEARLHAQVTNLSVTLGQKLLPAAVKVADYVSNTVIPGVQKWAAWVKQNRWWVTRLGEVLLILIGTYKLYSAATKVSIFWTKAFGTAAETTAVQTTLAGKATQATAATSTTALNKWVGRLGVVGATLLAVKALSDSASRNSHVDVYGSVRDNKNNGLVPGSKFSTAGGSIVTPGELAKGRAQIAELRRLYAGLASSLSGMTQSQRAVAKQAMANIQAAIKSADAVATAGAINVGRNLMAGIAIGIAQTRNAMLAQAKAVGGLAAHAIQMGARVSSPSKITLYVGRMLALGLVVGFHGMAGKVFRSMSADTQAILGSLHDRIDRGLERFRTSITRARDRLRNDLGAKRSLIGEVRDSLLGDSDISGAFTQDDQGGTVLGNVGNFLGSKLAQLRKFFVDLKRLRKLGLAPSLLRMVAAAGPVQGDQLALQILSGQSGSIGHLNKQQADINATATAIGGVVGGATYDKKIAQDRQNLRHQLHELKTHTRLLRGIITAILESATTPDGMAKALRKLKRELGHDLGLA